MLHVYVIVFAKQFFFPIPIHSNSLFSNFEGANVLFLFFVIVLEYTSTATNMQFNFIIMELVFLIEWIQFRGKLYFIYTSRHSI